MCNYERCAHLLVKILATKCLPLCKLERETNAHAHCFGGLFGGAMPNLWEPYVAAQALNFSQANCPGKKWQWVRRNRQGAATAKIFYTLSRCKFIEYIQGVLFCHLISQQCASWMYYKKKTIWILSLFPCIEDKFVCFFEGGGGEGGGGVGWFLNGSTILYGTEDLSVNHIAVAHRRQGACQQSNQLCTLRRTPKKSWEYFVIFHGYPTTRDAQNRVKGETPECIFFRLSGAYSLSLIQHNPLS